MTIRRALLPILLLSNTNIRHVDGRRLAREDHSVDDDDDDDSDDAKSATVDLRLRHVQQLRRTEAAGNDDRKRRKLPSKNDWCKFVSLCCCKLEYSFHHFVRVHTSYV